MYGLSIETYLLFVIVMLGFLGYVVYLLNEIVKNEW